MKKSRTALTRHDEQVRAQTDPNEALVVVDHHARSRRAGPLVAIGALVVGLTIGGIVLLTGDSGDDPVAATPTTVDQTPTAPTTTPPAAEPPTTAPATTVQPATAPPVEPANSPDDFVPTEPIATHRVVGVAADDVLNVRVAPDAGADLYASLAPTYAGLLATGNDAVAADGGTWMEVQLLHLTRVVGLGEPLHGGPAVGWVNSAFVETLVDGMPVGFDRLACDAGQIGVVPFAGGGTGEAADHIYSLDHASGDVCERVVVTLGSGFNSEFRFETTTALPSTQVPDGVVANEEYFAVTFEGVTHALDTEVETPHGPVLVTGFGDGRPSVTFTFPVASPSIRVLGDEGRVVLDYVPLAASANTTSDLVVLAADHESAPGVLRAHEGEPLFVLGWARPFEAALGVELTTTDGTPVAAAFFGSSILGDVVDTRYAVATSDYIEAWGWFDFIIEDLPPGEYELFLYSDGADEPQGARFPVVIDG